MNIHDSLFLPFKHQSINYNLTDSYHLCDDDTNNRIMGKGANKNIIKSEDVISDEMGSVLGGKFILWLA